jgi:signal transduction histidine kinase
MAVIVASQLTRSLVKPLRNVALAAEQLSSGDLAARAPVAGPPEIKQVSTGLNRLADRISELLTHERETLADLSHRLRTPLTALRIDAELISGDEELVARVIGDVDTLTRTVNEIIGEARRPSADSRGAICDAGAVLRERAAYWRPLAEDQERWMTVDIPQHHLPVRVPEPDLTACIDILLENVFAHTPEGTAFSVRASPRAGGGAWLVVSDNGPGFSHPDPARRGESSAGSTGLGLDIARRIAETSGGTLTLGRSPHGGGAVTIGLGPAVPQARKSRRQIRTSRQPATP